MFVACNSRDGVALQDGGTEPNQCFILAVFKETSFDPLKFNSDRIVVAVAAAAVTGGTRMPGAVIGVDELLEFAIATDEKVARHFHALDTFEVGVLVPVQLVGKKALHIVTTILTRRKTDAMQHDQVNRCP